MKLLMLVQNQADVDNLDAAARAILRSAITGVWCVFSPAITVNSSEAAMKFDTEIEQLRTAERQAADRSDYEAAKGYKTQREGKELDRAKALRDAWKTADEGERKIRTKNIFEPFVSHLQKHGGEKMSVRVTGHSDHYEKDQWVALLNSLSGAWFKPFTPGSFVVGWPESLASSLKVGGVDLRIGTPPKEFLTTATKGAAEGATAATPKTREQELTETHHMSLRPIAQKLGVDIAGMTKPQMVAAILAAEAAGAAPVAVEAY